MKISRTHRARVVYWASWAMAPTAVACYLWTSDRVLLALTLGISVWTQIATARADLDVVEPDDG